MKKNISYKLFKVYVIFFSVFISALLIIFGLYIGVDINNNIVKTQEQMLQSINNNIDNFFEDMNEFSISLKDSKMFKNIAINELPETYEANDNLSSYFRDMYLNAYKMIEKNYKVGLYIYDGYYIWLGNNYFINKTRVDGADYYKDYANYGNRNIDYINNNPFLEEFLKKHSGDGIVNEETIALSRTINDKNIFNRPQAMLEIHIPYSELEELMNRFSTNKGSKDMNLFLYDVNGNAIYGNDEFDIKNYMADGKITEGNYKYKKNIINIIPLQSSKLYLVSLIQSDKLYSSLNKYIALAIIIFLVVNIILMGITYKIAIRITTPLKDICSQIENIDLRKRSSYQYRSVQTDIHEIGVLNTTINNMQKKLVDSLDKIVSLESFEIQSKMLALQSQMQPHFLYNTLMTISALSEDNENEKVSRVCFALTHMLRYISSESTNNITIADEMQYVDRYMDIMQERFENIRIEWNVSFDMIDILVPKLIIQPLVENSLKYNEKCIISIDGFIKDNKWTIRVKDDGIGFSLDTINDLMKRCNEISKNYRTSSLKIDGMGILNIYIRLKLLYGDNMSFNIKNNQDGGCCVEIGGLVERFNDERYI